MNEIKIFENPAFGKIRTAGTSEEPLFCLADICRVLGLTNPSTVKSRLDTADVQLIDLHALNIGEGITSGNTTATFVSFPFALSGFCLQNEQSQAKTKINA